MPTDYTSLKQDILDFLERGGDPTITAKLDTIISLSESWINRRLAGYQREVTASLAANSEGEIALPFGFVGMRSVYFNDEPQLYSISGSTLSVRNGAAQSYAVTYFAKLTALSETNPTNWLMDAAPDAYLDACLMRACIFLQDAANANAYGTNAAAAIDELTMQNTVAQYSRATIQMRIAP